MPNTSVPNQENTDLVRDLNIECENHAVTKKELSVKEAEYSKLAE